MATMLIRGTVWATIDPATGECTRMGFTPQEGPVGYGEMDWCGDETTDEETREQWEEMAQDADWGERDAAGPWGAVRRWLEAHDGKVEWAE